MESPQSKPDNLDNWIWVIEYLAKYKTDISVLHDVFELCPNLPDYLGQQTNEMVAFRCLASLFDCKDIVVTDVNKSKKIEFDLSESCEYVLGCILDEVPLSELKPGAPGLSKWNVLPFLERKLVSLPKCALELMLEASREKDTGEETARVADADLTERKEDGRSLGDGADEIGRSHVSPCEGQETDQVTPRVADGTDEITRSHTSSEGHVSSPAESRYKCVQCKESEKLLFCSGDGCTVMVHEKCVADSSPPVYDDAGNFYCSQCAVTCVSAEYLQSQDEVAKAKKKLVSFLSLMAEINKKKSTDGSSLCNIKP